MNFHMNCPFEANANWPQPRMLNDDDSRVQINSCRSRLVRAFEIDNLLLHILVEAVFTICSANAPLPPTLMKPLNLLKVPSIHIGFTQSQLLASLQGHIEIPSVDR